MKVVRHLPEKSASVFTSVLTTLRMPPGLRNLLKQNSAVCGMRLRMPSPVSTLRKSEKKTCPPVLAGVAVNCGQSVSILLYFFLISFI